MKAKYQSGTSCCIEISDSASRTCMTVADAVRLKEELTKAIDDAEKDKREELTEFEKAVGLEVFDEPFEEEHIKVIKEESAKLLAIARNEIVKSGYAIIEGEHYLEEGRKNYERGKADALKDLQENLANNDIYSVPEWLREVLLMTKENGKKEALKDLPRWKKCDPHTIYDTKCNFVVNGIGRYIILDGYMIDVDRLEKLPGFKED